MTSFLDSPGQVRIVCMTNALAEMRHHYRDVLALEVLEIFEEDHGLRLKLRGDTEIQLINAEGGATTGMHLSIQVASVDDAYSTTGTVAQAEPADQPWGHRNFTTADPDGNKITFFQILQGAG
ncbi:MAG: VOC family protein [Acidimicrobiia bacterium]